MAKFLAALILALTLGLFAGAAGAQDSTPTDDQVNAIAKHLYCPVCENTPLDVCPTEACRQWRDLIRQQLSDGWTEDQIRAYFVENYGARVLAEPPRQGLNWLVYLLPPVIILAGRGGRRRLRFERRICGASRRRAKEKKINQIDLTGFQKPVRSLRRIA